MKEKISINWSVEYLNCHEIKIQNSATGESVSMDFDVARDMADQINDWDIKSVSNPRIEEWLEENEDKLITQYHSLHPELLDDELSDIVNNAGFQEFALEQMQEAV